MIAYIVFFIRLFQLQRRQLKLHSLCRLTQIINLQNSKYYNDSRQMYRIGSNACFNTLHYSYLFTLI